MAQPPGTERLQTTSRLRRKLCRGALILGVPFLTLAPGCAGDERDPGRIVAAVIDQTPDSPNLTAAAREAIDIAVPAAASDSGTFLGGVVTTRVIQTADLEPKNFSSDRRNNVQVERDLAEQAERYLDSEDVMRLARGYSGGVESGSDLLAVPHLVYVELQPLLGGASRPIDIVFVTNGQVVSDMDGIALDFLHDPLDQAQTDAIIGRMRESRMLPRFPNGTRIHFVGLGRDPRISSDQSLRIAEFWRTLAHSMNAEAILINSGESLNLDEGRG